jgi:hypothetical protein
MVGQNTVLTSTLSLVDLPAMNSEVRQPHRPGADDANWVVWLW